MASTGDVRVVYPERVNPAGMTGRLGQEMLLVHHMMPRITDQSCSQTALA
jgi:hypothetical protein